jgi:hypothetical protein
MDLYLSSFVLGTNALHAFLKHYTAYGISFTALTITSILYHTSAKDESLYVSILFWLDQCVIYTIFVIGLYYTFQIPPLQLIAAIISISLCALYYKYGCITNQFCWDPQFGTLYHNALHIIGSLGHHAILLGLQNL